MRLHAPRWFLSFHALERMTQMGVKRPEVVEALTDPDMVYPGRDGCQIAVGGRLAVVHKHPDVVVTVLWHAKEGRQADV